MLELTAIDKPRSVCCLPSQPPRAPSIAFTRIPQHPRAVAESRNHPRCWWSALPQRARFQASVRRLQATKRPRRRQLPPPPEQLPPQCVASHCFHYLILPQPVLIVQQESSAIPSPPSRHLVARAPVPLPQGTSIACSSTSQLHQPLPLWLPQQLSRSRCACDAGSRTTAPGIIANTRQCVVTGDGAVGKVRHTCSLAAREPRAND